MNGGAATHPGWNESRQDLARHRDELDYGRHVNPDRLAALLSVAASPVLDVGCATAGYVRELARRGLQANGVDALLPLHRREWAGLWAAVADLRALPFPDGSFHTVSLFEVLEHVKDTAQAVAEIRRVATHWLVLSVPDATRHPSHEPAGYAFHHWLDRTHHQAFTPDALRRCLSDGGWVVERLTGINQVTPEVLVLAQYRLPATVRRLLLRMLRRLPGRRPTTMTLLAVARRAR